MIYNNVVCTLNIIICSPIGGRVNKELNQGSDLGSVFLDLGSVFLDLGSDFPDRFSFPRSWF